MPALRHRNTLNAAGLSRRWIVIGRGCLIKHFVSFNLGSLTRLSIEEL